MISGVLRSSSGMTMDRRSASASRSCLGALKIIHIHDTLVATRGKQRSFVDEIRDRSGKSRTILRARTSASTSRAIGCAYEPEGSASPADCRAGTTTTVETSRTQRSGSSTSGRLVIRNHDDTGNALKTIHFYQKLAKGLLAFKITSTPAPHRAAGGRIDFVDEDDAWCLLLWPAQTYRNPRRANPTNISTKSDTKSRKTGTLASPAMALARASYPCRADQPSERPRNVTASLKPGRIAQEFNEFPLPLWLRRSQPHRRKWQRYSPTRRVSWPFDFPKENAHHLSTCIWRMKKPIRR